MSCLEQNTVSIVCSIVVLLCAGCRSSDVADSVTAAGATVVVVPVASVAIAAYEVDVAAQGSSIAVGAPKQLYSQLVTKSDLWRMNMQHGCKFHEPWKYMGTKDGEHYLAIYPFLGFREVYRIAEDEYPIEEPFELTARSSKWREVMEFSHLGIEQAFIIEPQLFELPEGLVPFRIDAIQGAGFGGDFEDLFMQEVPILEGE
jgi:hypothetical protein